MLDLVKLVRTKGVLSRHYHSRKNHFIGDLDLFNIFPLLLNDIFYKCRFHFLL